MDNETRIESRSRSLRGGSKRTNSESDPQNGKRFRRGNLKNHDVSNHSFVTTDEVRPFLPGM